MQALGLIETRGLVPAIEAADVMLKTAQVELVERTFVGGGLVTIAVTGEVGAVKVAVEAAAAAVDRFGPPALISQHVIARPHQDIDGMVLGAPEPDQESLPPQEETAATVAVVAAPAVPEQLTKMAVDTYVDQAGLAQAMAVLKACPVVKLRALAREYKDLEIAGRAISNANKDLLLQILESYYGRGRTQ